MEERNDEFTSICQGLKAKGVYPDIKKLFGLKKEQLNKALLNSTDKDKCWDIKLSINFLETLAKEIESKGNKINDTDN